MVTSASLTSSLTLMEQIYTQCVDQEDEEEENNNDNNDINNNEEVIDKCSNDGKLEYNDNETMQLMEHYNNNINDKNGTISKREGSHFYEYKELIFLENIFEQLIDILGVTSISIDVYGDRKDNSKLCLNYEHQLDIEKGRFPMKINNIQSGVLRINCLDSLDRTNIIQAVATRCFLRKYYGEKKCRKLWRRAFNLIHNQGIMIGLSYAGTGALHSKFTDTEIHSRKRKKCYTFRDGCKAIKRYIQNTYYDGKKQDGINLATGSFRISNGKCYTNGKEVPIPKIKCRGPFISVYFIEFFFICIMIAISIVFRSNIYCIIIPCLIIGITMTIIVLVSIYKRNIVVDVPQLGTYNLQ